MPVEKVTIYAVDKYTDQIRKKIVFPAYLEAVESKRNACFFDEASAKKAVIERALMAEARAKEALKKAQERYRKCVKQFGSTA